jgi:hypothetical protein
LLRTARIKGWQPNLSVLIDGQVFYIDIAFKQQKLAIEIDGRLDEADEDLFESDRWRQNALVADSFASGTTPLDPRGVRGAHARPLAGFAFHLGDVA